MLVGGELVWRPGQFAVPRLKPGDWVTLLGSGFGNGPDIDFAKVLVGNVRALERDLTMYEGKVDLLDERFFQTARAFDRWPSDIRRWTDTVIEFRVPATAVRGPIVVHVQKRVGSVPSARRRAAAHAVWDPLTERVESSSFRHGYDVVSTLGAAVESEPIPVVVENPSIAAERELGARIFWSYDYNIGLVHSLQGLDWTRILAGKATDPTTGGPADPQRLFGAIPARPGEVPAFVTETVLFDPYPMPMPIKPLFRKPLYSGVTSPTGYVGYMYAESVHPARLSKDNWIGFSCVSCHGARVTYEEAPGRTVSRVFPGLPNAEWSMKWTALGNLKGVRTRECGPDGVERWVDKTRLLFAVPPGTGEHNLVRHAGDGSPYANDNLFSPIAIPIITRHLPIRRALSHTEMIAGFEGSYIHSQEPDGAIGAMRSADLKRLTAYMDALDGNDALLNRLGLYRWLVRSGRLGEVDGAGEGAFVQRGPGAYPRLRARLERGRDVFRRDCASCHADNFGTYSDENMLPLTEVGTYFSPTIYHRKHASIRTAILRNLYWVERRGLLHDGHVKSMEDLVTPERCDSRSELYRRYYTLHSETFRVPKGNAEQERALRNHAYFVDVSWDREHLYWDYQQMRRAFGPRELGTAAPTPLPATPHPWCVSSPAEVDDLVAYLMTL
jgi:hypothetical protein